LGNDLVKGQAGNDTSSAARDSTPSRGVEETHRFTFNEAQGLNGVDQLRDFNSSLDSNWSSTKTSTQA
jgi:hypothetical protein